MVMGASSNDMIFGENIGPSGLPTFYPDKPFFIYREKKKL